MVAILGRKIGMTRIFDTDGREIPVSVIVALPNRVVQQRTVERDGYSAVVLAGDEADEKKVGRPQREFFKRSGTSSYSTVREVRGFSRECAVGDTIDVSIFNGARHVDVVGYSKGKGFQGVIKRHGFSGGNKTHGSKFHRAGGSTGMAATPSRVLKNTRMAGRMGFRRTTVQNLRLEKIDVEHNALLVRGAIPGARRQRVVVFSARKRT